MLSNAVIQLSVIHYKISVMGNHYFSKTFMHYHLHRRFHCKRRGSMTLHQCLGK